MQFETNMRGQVVTINYGTNPQGQVAGVWMRLADGTYAKDMTTDEEAEAFKLANHHQANQVAHADITPPSCSVYSSTEEHERCPRVVLLHKDASPAQLLGYAHDRCCELAMLANLASCGNSSESELRQVTQHLWNGLEAVVKTLDMMSVRMARGAA